MAGGRPPAYVSVPVAQLRPSTANIRDDLGDLRELADSIRAVGILQPLVVSVRDGKATVVDGHRRLAAAKIAGLKTLPCLVGEIAGREQTVLTMLAAAMHKSLAPMEQSEAFTRLIDLGMSRAQIARQTGYSLATIDNRLLLSHLPAEAGRMVADRQLSVGEATKLARQVRDSRSGSVTHRTSRASWFTTTHPLHRAAGALCTSEHAETRARHAGACGQCWEQAIRDDA